MNQHKIEIYCKSCSSTNVRRNADVIWSLEAQEWELVAVFDAASCEDCGDSDASLGERDAVLQSM